MFKDFTQQKFSFADIHIDPTTNSISRNNSVKRVEPKIILLLSYFAEHPNRVISREELMKAVWPNIIVGEEVVTRAILR